MSYNKRVLKRFDMHECKSRDTPIVKGDKFNLSQCPKGNVEIQEMKKIPYVSVVGSLMHA